MVAQFPARTEWSIRGHQFVRVTTQLYRIDVGISCELLFGFDKKKGCKTLRAKFVVYFLIFSAKKKINLCNIFFLISTYRGNYLPPNVGHMLINLLKDIVGMIKEENDMLRSSVQLIAESKI